MVLGEVPWRGAAQHVRVLNVNALIDPVTGGGTAERTVQMSRALRDAGMDSAILTTDVGLRGDFSSSLEGIQVTAYRCLMKRFYLPIVRYAKVKGEVEKADVIHLMGHWSVLNALVYIAAKAMNRPYVVCPAGALRIYGRSRLLKHIYNFLIGKRIIRHASAWIAITADERSQFEAYGVERKKVLVIPNGINLADYEKVESNKFRERHGLVGRPFVLFLGRLNSIKGPDILLEAFCRGQQTWPDWHLVFAGPDGGLLNTLRTTVENGAVRDRVHFIGYVGGAEKAAAYHAADLLVIPSRHEAMSIVVLEAGISGTPVLLTDQCGFDVVDKVDGGRVVAATVEGIYGGLAGLLADRNILPTLGGKLRDYVRGKYSWDVIVRKYLNLYARLVANAGK